MLLSDTKIVDAAPAVHGLPAPFQFLRPDFAAGLEENRGSERVGGFRLLSCD
jgi:hypothetical protein